MGFLHEIFFSVLSLHVSIGISDTIPETAQVICNGVGGNPIGLSSTTQLFSLSDPTSCPNSPDNACLYPGGPAMITTSYDTSNINGDFLTFTIDYEVDTSYGAFDNTEIFYDCGNGFQSGTIISQANGNSFARSNYDNIGFFLPVMCSNNTNVTIKIEHNVFNPILFAFDNLCIGTIMTNPVSNFDDQIFRDGVPANATVSPASVQVCFDIKSTCINPSLRIVYAPIDFEDPGKFIGVEYAGIPAMCAFNVTSSCRSNIDELKINECVNPGDLTCGNIFISDNIQSCSLSPFVPNFTL